MRIHFSKATGWAVLLVVMLMMTVSARAQAAQDFSAILADPERPSEERALDAARKPDEVIKFYGVKAGDKVGDIWAGRGYYTAILAQVWGRKAWCIRQIPPRARNLRSDGRSRPSPTSK